MKTDVVLTMDEYFDQCCVATKHVRPPASDARHISITGGDNLDLNAGQHGCRCDRWGHPCPGCLEHKLQTRTTAPDFSSANK
jgi:hypothetical protein